MRLLLKELNIPWLPYDPKCDPTRQALPLADIWLDEFTKREWTIGPRAVSMARKRLVTPETKPVARPSKKRAKETDSLETQESASGCRKDEQLDVSVKSESIVDDETKPGDNEILPSTDCIKPEPHLIDESKDNVALTSIA